MQSGDLPRRYRAAQGSHPDGALRRAHPRRHRRRDHRGQRRRAAVLGAAGGCSPCNDVLPRLTPALWVDPSCPKQVLCGLTPAFAGFDAVCCPADCGRGGQRPRHTRRRPGVAPPRHHRSARHVSRAGAAPGEGAGSMFVWGQSLAPLQHCWAAGPPALLQAAVLGGPCSRERCLQQATAV